MKLHKIIGITGIALLSTVLVACGSPKNDKNTITVGVMTKTESDQARWDKIEELLKKKMLRSSIKSLLITINLIKLLIMVR